MRGSLPRREFENVPRHCGAIIPPRIRAVRRCGNRVSDHQVSVEPYHVYLDNAFIHVHRAKSPATERKYHPLTWPYNSIRKTRDSLGSRVRHFHIRNYKPIW